MKLLENLVQQLKDGALKPKDTLQDWLDTLQEKDLEELERLITLQEDDPENDETEIVAQLVEAVYAIEKGTISVSDAGELELEEIEDEEFFNLLNSFLFLMPFYYWLKQDLVKISTKLSLIANREGKITVTLTEYGK